MTGGALGTKAVSLGDLDNFLDWLVDEDGTDPQDLYKAVAWNFWCVNLRANCVAAIPFGVYPQGEEDFTTDNEVEFDLNLAPYLWTTEAWLNLKAAAYWLKRRNRVQVADLQILNSNTMKVLEYDADGPTVFEQKVGAKRKTYPAEDIVYFRTFSPKTDIREGVASGRVAELPALLVKNANEWAEAFFANGAVPLTVLMSAGAVPPVEQERIRSVWKRLYQGVKKAFSTAVLQHGLEAKVIGQPIKDLAMPELERTKKEQILASHEIPIGYAEAKTNRAERWALKEQLYTDAIIPRCNNILVPVIDEQLLNPMGLRLGFRYKEIEALQRSEIEKAESASFMISGVMLPAYEANTVAVPEVRRVLDALLQMAALPALDATFTPEERIAPPMLGAGDEETPPGAGEQPGQGPPPKAMLGALARWEHKAITRIKEGRADKALAFEDQAIPATVHSMVVLGLERAVTLGDVAEVFKAARGEHKSVRIIPEGVDDPPIPIPATVEITEADWDIAIRDWDRSMPEYSGMLEAEVINKETYDNAGTVAMG
jgi:HK97 family phage portal protein